MSTPVKVDIRQLPHAQGLPLPAYQSTHAAGLDLLAAVPEATPLVLAPGKHAMIPTGLTIALPSGYEAQIRPRSGLAAKHGVTVLNSPGTVDADYRGEIAVILINHGDAPFPIRMRIVDADGAELFSGETSTARMKRSPRDLAAWVTRDNPVPAGSVLLTGTGLVPPDDYTLLPGHVVEIEIEGIGLLRNTVEA